ncbi:triphosphoribosyl-dephospho-CoA synthase CitG [Vibrio sp. SCSIO 43137]|uniref:triphosphoribosyl-dephospho-CoA synthase CitG n=1 Tax=Vibrio sp. SCSIO 43137 TaxID=3021011 RepID=UPI002306EA67|nr:triphosphoribosyl-dephospho-CoA synthase CitG [Vibrio sp. SCSIO 43137]WCE32453.1 triphosphoribosyl-dephospho-CoA synthase CitG [Vibrio sp. SCSIO 43137]
MQYKKAAQTYREAVGTFAYNAMLKEARLTPKAGLVDSVSQGAHTDMDISTFVASSEALKPYMLEFVCVGYQSAHITAENLLPQLRKTGLQAEQAMLKATQGVNTHKGMIFTMGLICGAAGWLQGNKQAFSSADIRPVIVDMCRHLVRDELVRKKNNGKNNEDSPVSAGERIFAEHDITGIRGEASQGYPVIFKCSLPFYRQAMAKHNDEHLALSYTLLKLMAENCDTNLIHRGGLEGLAYVKQQSAKYLKRNYSGTDELNKSIEAFDQKLINRHLSPGGSADLLAATWLLYQLDELSRDFCR